MSNLIFNAENHTYHLDGIELPSVTTVLQKNKINNYDKIPKEVLDRAQKFGTAVHKVTELWDRERLNTESVSEPLIPYLEAWKQFKDDFGVEIIHNELKVYSEKFGYAGTIDRIGRINKGKLSGRLAVIDIKTGILLPSIALQTAAYQQAYNELYPREKVKNRICVQLKDNKYTPKTHDNKTDFSVFQACLQIINFKRLNKIK